MKFFTKEEWRSGGNYYKYREKMKIPSWLENTSFHDCVIRSAVKSGKNLVLSIDNSGGFTDIYELTFKNYKILEQEVPLEDTCCMSTEYYEINGVYEVHLLLISQHSKEEDKLAYVTISATNITYKSDPHRWDEEKARMEAYMKDYYEQIKN